MKLGRLLGGLSTASALAVASLGLASPAGAAATPPASYAAVARAYPVFWDGYSGIPVEDELRVPYVSGLTNHAPLARAEAALTLPDLSSKTLSGEQIHGLTCTGYAENRCTDPFLPEAGVSHSSVDPVDARQEASFGGRENKYPGHIQTVNSCGGDCGKQLVRTAAEAAAPPGSIPHMIAIGSSLARQEVTVDESGRVVGVAVSELRNVAIGPEGEVTFSRLTSTARATGAGAENAKDGHGNVSVSDMVILGNPVELTGAGLKLSHGAVSEQEAYDGAKALLAKLRDEHGITLQFGDQADDIVREAAQVTVRVDALSVRFDPSVQAPQSVGRRIDQVVYLGSSTMVVMAFDQERQIDVSYEGEDVVVEAEPEGKPAPAPASGPAPVPPTGGGATTSTAGPAKPGQPGPSSSRPGNADVKVRVKKDRNAPADTPTTPPVAPEPEVAEGDVPPPVSTESSLPPSTSGSVDEEAFGLSDISQSLKDARAVSGAFGAFLALGLVLPLARFVIKRFG